MLNQVNSNSPTKHAKKKEKKNQQQAKRERERVCVCVCVQRLNSLSPNGAIIWPGNGPLDPVSNQPHTMFRFDGRLLTVLSRSAHLKRVCWFSRHMDTCSPMAALKSFFALSVDLVALGRELISMIMSPS